MVGAANRQPEVEPHRFAARKPALDLDAYPGSIRIFEEALESERALRGISGEFGANGERFAITAGAMTAASGGGARRDQRGLIRAARREPPTSC
ncbi:MAG: hypothetical protein R3F11_09815 [Verrucomicrobiales bacterium]